MLTNWGDLLTNVPSNGGGAAIAPADYAGTLTVANQAARLALVYGTGTGQVQELDQVFQTSDSTLWVLLASDPSVSGNWGALNQFAASQITSGTLDSARLPTVPTTKGGTGLTALGTALQVLRTNAGATAAEWATITAGLSWTSPTTNVLGRYSGGAIVDAAISDDGTNVSITRAPRVTLSGTTYLGLTSAGLAINKGTTAASKMLEVVDSAAAQLRLTHTAGTYYADFLARHDGTLEIRPSGGITAVLHTLRIYEANLLNQADISCGATGRLLFGSNPVIPTATPSSASATGIAGEVAWDGSYIYIATATNAWKRVAIATW